MVGTSMKKYARIQDGLVVELLTTERDITTMFNPALVWVDVSSHAAISEGWRIDGDNSTPPSASPPPAPAPTLAELQAQIVTLRAQIEALPKT
jgi:hypothetical protein